MPASRDYCPPQDRLPGFPCIQTPHSGLQKDMNQPVFPETHSYTKNMQKGMPRGNNNKQTKPTVKHNTERQQAAHGTSDNLDLCWFFFKPTLT